MLGNIAAPPHRGVGGGQLAVVVSFPPIVRSAGAKFMIAEFERGSSAIEMFSLPFTVLCNNDAEQKIPAKFMTGTTQDRAKRHRIRYGATPGAAPFYDHAYRLRVCR